MFPENLRPKTSGASGSFFKNVDVSSFGQESVVFAVIPNKLSTISFTTPVGIDDGVVVQTLQVVYRLFLDYFDTLALDPAAHIFLLASKDLFGLLYVVEEQAAFHLQLTLGRFKIFDLDLLAPTAGFDLPMPVVLAF